MLVFWVSQAPHKGGILVLDINYGNIRASHFVPCSLLATASFQSYRATNSVCVFLWDLSCSHSQHCSQHSDFNPESHTNTFIFKLLISLLFLTRSLQLCERPGLWIWPCTLSTVGLNLQQNPSGNSQYISVQPQSDHMHKIKGLRCQNPLRKSKYTWGKSIN